jgi:hypothetical protein
LEGDETRIARITRIGKTERARASKNLRTAFSGNIAETASVNAEALNYPARSRGVLLAR